MKNKFIKRHSEGLWWWFFSEVMSSLLQHSKISLVWIQEFSNFFHEFSIRLFLFTRKFQKTNTKKCYTNIFKITAWKNKCLQCKQMETVAQTCQKILEAFFSKICGKKFGKKGIAHREQPNAQKYVVQQSNNVLCVSSNWFRINSDLLMILFYLVILFIFIILIYFILNDKKQHLLSFCFVDVT